MQQRSSLTIAEQQERTLRIKCEAAVGTRRRRILRTTLRAEKIKCEDGIMADSTQMPDVIESGDGALLQAT